MRGISGTPGETSAGGRALRVVLLVLVVVAIVTLVLAQACGSESPSNESGNADAPARARNRARVRAPAAGAIGRDRAPANVAADPEVEDDPAHEPRPPPPGGDGAISGELSDEPTGEPVEGATVVVLHPTGDEVAKQTTDERGRFSVKRLPHDVPLIVRLSSPKHLNGVLGRVRLRAHRTEHIDVALHRGYPVEVELDYRWLRRSKRSERISTEVVVLRGERSVARAVVHRNDREKRQTTRVSVPESGDYVLRVQPSAPDAELALVPFEVLPGVGTRPAQVEVRLREGRRVTIRVVEDESLVPVAGAVVRLAQDGDPTPTAVTDADGWAEFRGRRSTSATFEAAHVARGLAGTLDVGSLRGGSFTMWVRPSEIVTVRAQDVAGAVPAGAEFRLLDKDGNLVWDAGAADDGTAVVSRSLGGGADSLSLEVTAPGHVTERFDLGDVLARKGTLDVRLARVGAGRVRGAVRDQKGEPIAGATVRASPDGLTATTLGDGTFTLAGVASGREILLTARSEGHRMPPAGGIRVRLRGGRATDVVLTMLERGLGARDQALERAVNGAVEAPGGGPVHGAVVRIGGEQAITDVKGRYTVPHALFPAGGDTVAVLSVTPPPGLLVGHAELIAAGETSVLRAPTIRLVARPFATVVVSLPGGGNEGDANRFVLVSEEDDFAGGRQTEALDAIECVSYDGHWPLLPRSDVTDDRGAFRVAAVAAHQAGPLCSVVEWRPRLNDVALLRVDLGDSTGTMSTTSRGGARSRDRITLTHLSSPRELLLDNRRERKPRSVDPVAASGVYRTVRTLLGDARKAPLAAGKWELTWIDRKQRFELGAGRRVKLTVGGN